jgi:tetratricopeptide (TPR) repeat protein/CHAT domain-containing protein
MRCKAALFAVLTLGPLFSTPDATAETPDREGGEIERKVAALDALVQRVSRLRREGKIEEAVALAETVLDTQRRLLGDEGLQVAATRNALGELYVATQSYEKALPLFEASLAVRKRLLGNYHADVVQTQTNLADVLTHAEQYDKALGLLRAALAAQLKTLGPDHLAIAATLESIGFIYQALDDYSQGADHLKRSLAMRQKLLGGEHALVARSMAHLAVLFEGLGDVNKAFELQSLALSMRGRLLGEEHPEVAESMLHLAYLHHGRGEHEKALSLCRPAVAIQEKKLPKQHPQTAAGLDLLANLQRQTGSPEAALLTAESALNMRRALFGEEHPDVAASMRTLALAHRAKGNREKALELHEKALAMQQKLLGEDDPELLGNLDDLVALYEEAGDHAKALPLCRTALELVQKYEVADSRQVLARMDMLGRLYEATGDHRRALEAFENALRLYKASDKTSDSELALRLEHLARVHSAMGDRQKALEYEKEVLLLRKDQAGANGQDLAQNLLSIASLQEATGDREKALSSYLKALDVMKPHSADDHPEVLKAMSSVARLYEESGETEKAVALLRNVLAGQKKSLGENHLKVAETLGRLGGLYKRAGGTENALLAYQSALAIRQKQLGDDHPEVAISKNNLASLLQSLGDPFRSRKLYESSLAVYRKHYGIDHPQLMTIQNNLAILLAGLGDRMGARDLLKSSMLIEDDIYNELLPALSDAQKLELLADMESTADIFFSLLLASSVALRDDSPARLLEFAWARKNLVADFALPQKSREVATESQAARDLAAELLSAQRNLTELTWSPQTYLKPEDILRRRKELRDDIQRMAIALSRLSPSFRDGHREHYVHVGDVLAVLPQNAALVEFFGVRWCDFDRQTFTGRHIIALVLTHNEGVRIADMGSSAELADLVQQYRLELASSYAQASAGDKKPAEWASDLLRSAGRRLYTRLFEPFPFRLAGIKRLYLAPTDVLYLLPFEALATTSGEFLGDVYEVRLLCSGKDLATKRLAGMESAPAIFANPAFDRSAPGQGSASSGPFPPLPETAREAQETAACLERALPAKAKVFTGADASEAKLRATVAPKILHLATHSFVIGVPGEAAEEAGTGTRAAEERLKAAARLFQRTGLALAGANHPQPNGPGQGAGEDGRLTAIDVAGLNLEGTEMVVLSNNATNVIDPNAGLAAYALCRSFQVAGSPVLVRTLWQIPLAPREQLLKEFYSNCCKKRLSPPEAMAAARQSLRRSKAATAETIPFGHPYLWSAFVVVQTGP